MKVLKIALTLVIALLITALISGLVLFMDNGQSNYYVEYGGRMISSEYSNLEMTKDAYTVFNVKNVFGDAIQGVPSKDYEITVTLCEKNVADLDFTLDGNVQSLYEVKDFTAAFKITKTDGAFTVYIPRNFTLEEILSACYPDNEISVTDDISLWETDCFVLNVRFTAEKRVVPIAFH